MVGAMPISEKHFVTTKSKDDLLSNIATQMETQLRPRRKDRKRSYSRDLYWLLRVEKNKVITPDWDKQGWVGPCVWLTQPLLPSLWSQMGHELDNRPVQEHV